MFKIKFPYYAVSIKKPHHCFEMNCYDFSFFQKSEPIKSTLTLVTGEKSVTDAIGVYFDIMKDIFTFNIQKCELRLTNDYFSKEFRDTLKPHLVLSKLITTTTSEALSSSYTGSGDELMHHDGTISGSCSPGTTPESNPVEIEGRCLSNYEGVIQAINDGQALINIQVEHTDSKGLKTLKWERAMLNRY
jgi:hypothetical protein